MSRMCPALLSGLAVTQSYRERPEWSMGYDIIQRLSVSLIVLSAATVLTTLTMAVRFKDQQCVNRPRLGLISTNSRQVPPWPENTTRVGNLSPFGLIGHANPCRGKVHDL